MIGLYDEQTPQETDPDTGLPVGPLLDNPTPAQRPQRINLDGRYCRLEPLDVEAHLAQLFIACTPQDAAARFRYLPDLPPDNSQQLLGWMHKAAASSDPLFFAVIDKRSGHVGGRQALMRITPEHQSIEIGNIYWGPKIAQTPVTTEANYLFAKYVFEDLAYRRYEWKCDALNTPSRRAALRFGFQFEGHFRRAVINRGRSRDTVWFSIIDEDWPALKAAYTQWLESDNFTAEGQQKTRLSQLTRK